MYFWVHLIKSKPIGVLIPIKCVIKKDIDFTGCFVTIFQIEKWVNDINNCAEHYCCQNKNYYYIIVYNFFFRISFEVFFNLAEFGAALRAFNHAAHSNPNATNYYQKGENYYNEWKKLFHKIFLPGTEIIFL